MGNLITSSNIEMNDCPAKKMYHGVGMASSIVIAIFVGTTLLQPPVMGKIAPRNNLSKSSYIKYIDLEQEKGLEDLHTNKNIDLMKVENLNKIMKMALFSSNWNGTGGSKFSTKAITLFKSIIEALDKQPQIAPTGRNSLLLQYELDDKSLLAFEVKESQTEKVYIPHGDYSMAQMDIFTENVGQMIKESVNKFYGIG